MSSLINNLKYSKIIDLDKYEHLGFDKRKEYLINKKVLVNSGIYDTSDDDEYFYFNTNSDIVYGNSRFRINRLICFEFFELISNKIEKEGVCFLELNTKKINYDVEFFKQKKDKIDFLNEIISQNIKIINNEENSEVFNKTETWKEFVLNSFGNELFNYIVNGFEIILNEIELGFTPNRLNGIDITNKFDFLSNNMKLDFLKYKYEELTTDYYEPDTNYEFYKNGELYDLYYSEMDAISSIYSGEEYDEKIDKFINKIRKEQYDYLIEYYTSKVQYILGYPVSVYKSLYEKSKLINSWINLYKAKHTISCCYSLLSEINASKEEQFEETNSTKRDVFENIFNDDIYEKLFLKVLINTNALDPDGKAKKRKFQPICDAFFDIYNDLKSQIFKYSTTKRSYIEYLNLKFDAKINDLSKLSSGIKHQDIVNKMVSDLLKEINSKKLEDINS